jgi:hypothetical protein
VKEKKEKANIVPVFTLEHVRVSVSVDKGTFLCEHWRGVFSP